MYVVSTVTELVTAVDRIRRADQLILRIVLAELLTARKTIESINWRPGFDCDCSRVVGNHAAAGDTSAA